MEENGEIATYKWSIWDLAGQPKFSNVRPVFYQGAFGALLCFDVTRLETFENLDKWVDELRRHTHTEGVPIVLIATKMDLYEEGTHIEFARVEEYKNSLVEKLGDRFNVSLVKTSAKTGFNVKEAFKELRGSITKWINSQDDY
ncbi:MAG: GTP-binding protein [Candidatus Heimdallarchaeota archaeon]|nr:GTP-binding protein [Candidatus Heimdallarchaeota archaeon]